jgi:hypothetical protein
MGGCLKTSTHDVTTKTPRSLCLKSKILANASAAIPTLSGHLTLGLLVIVLRCCSTCLAKGTSQTKEQAGGYSVSSGGGLGLVDGLPVS